MTNATETHEFFNDAACACELCEGRWDAEEDDFFEANYFDPEDEWYAREAQEENDLHDGVAYRDRNGRVQYPVLPDPLPLPYEAFDV